MKFFFILYYQPMVCYRRYDFLFKMPCISRAQLSFFPFLSLMKERKSCKARHSPRHLSLDSLFQRAHLIASLRLDCSIKWIKRRYRGPFSWLGFNPSGTTFFSESHNCARDWWPARRWRPIDNLSFTVDLLKEKKYSIEHIIKGQKARSLLFFIKRRPHEGKNNPHFF